MRSGAIWVEIEKSRSETDQSRGKQAGCAGCWALTNKAAVPAAASLINFDRWPSWLPGTFIKEDRSCRMSSLPEWLWLEAGCKENRAPNHLSCRGKIMVHLYKFCLFKKANYLFTGFYTLPLPPPKFQSFSFHTWPIEIDPSFVSLLWVSFLQIGPTHAYKTGSIWNTSLTPSSLF